MKISFFETRTRIFSFNLVLRDENENFFFQSRVSRREREIENHFSWSSEKKSGWFSREFPGSRILAMLWFEYMVEWGLMAFHQSSLRTNEVELSRRDGGRNTLLSYRYSQRFFKHPHFHHLHPHLHICSKHPGYPHLHHLHHLHWQNEGHFALKILNNIW